MRNVKKRIQKYKVIFFYPELTLININFCNYESKNVQKENETFFLQDLKASRYKGVIKVTLGNIYRGIGTFKRIFGFGPRKKDTDLAPGKTQRSEPKTLVSFSEAAKK